MNISKIYLYAAVITISFSCGRNSLDHSTVIDKIKHKTAESIGDTITLTAFEDKKLIEIDEEGHRFYILDLKSNLKSYSCTECHQGGIEKLKLSDSLKNGHWDIEILHAKEQIMNCQTCHNTNDINNLKSLTSKTIDFNQSHQLCSQCHSNQYKDWLGGAHGKKISGWGPPRVSMSCVNCHNPHKPAFGKRWPARFNTSLIDK